MQLMDFQILNFRSINDSGKIDVSRITALLGRNESGKSNLLRGLHSLSPASGFTALNPIKDFPRHRRLTECHDHTPVVRSTWTLNPKEQAELEAIWHHAKGVREVTVGRNYNGKTRSVGIAAPVRDFDHAEIKTKVNKVVAAVKAKASELDDAPKAALLAAADAFYSEIGASKVAVTWAETAKPALANIRQALAKADAELSDTQDQHVSSLEQLAEQIPEDEASHVKAIKWILEKLPVFMFLEDYPEIEGHQDIAAFLTRCSTPAKTNADINFEKLCKVAGLNPEQLQSLLSSNDQETRSQLANRAGSVVTTAIRNRWKDRPLKVRFNLDAQHFDTLISDPN